MDQYRRTPEITPDVFDETTDSKTLLDNRGDLIVKRHLRIKHHAKIPYGVHSAKRTHRQLNMKSDSIKVVNLLMLNAQE